MAIFETWIRSDLKKLIKTQPLPGDLFSADVGANLIGVEVLDDGAPATLSGTVTGYVIRGDGATVSAISGTLSGNKASIVLPQSAYTVDGPISVVIKLTTNGVITTLGAASGHVQRTTSDTILDPGHVIPSLEELLAQIDECEAATDAANAAAAKLEDMDATVTTLAAGTDATVGVSTVSDHYRIAFGIPRGQNATVSGTATTYQNSTSGNTVPTGTWQTTQPTTPQGQFLWTRTILTWNNGGTTTLYSVSRQGIDGSGSVSSVNNISPDANGNVTLPVDAAPTSGSENLAQSGGVYTALADKVSKAGDTMTDNLAITRSNNYPSLFFTQAIDASTNPRVMIQPSIAGTQPQFAFYQQTGDSSSWEGYKLPATATGLTSNVNYDILTTKTFPVEDIGSHISFTGGVTSTRMKATRQGKVCTIEYMSDSLAASSWTQNKLLFTIDAGYRPTISTFVIAAITATPFAALISVGDDGKVSFYSANGTLAGNPRVYLNLSYTCA